MKNFVFYLLFIITFIVLGEIERYQDYTHWNNRINEIQQSLDSGMSKTPEMDIEIIEKVYIPISNEVAFSWKHLLILILILIFNGTAVYLSLKFTTPNIALISSSFLTITFITLLHYDSLSDFISNISVLLDYIEFQLGIWSAVILINYALIKAQKALTRCLLFTSSLLAAFLLSKIFIWYLKYTDLILFAGICFMGAVVYFTDRKGRKLNINSV